MTAFGPSCLRLFQELGCHQPTTLNDPHPQTCNWFEAGVDMMWSGEEVLFRLPPGAGQLCVQHQPWRIPEYPRSSKNSLHMGAPSILREHLVPNGLTSLGALGSKALGHQSSSCFELPGCCARIPFCFTCFPAIGREPFLDCFGSKYSVFEASGCKDHSRYGFWNQIWEFKTSTALV